MFLNVEAIEHLAAKGHSRLAAETVRSTGSAVITVKLDGLVTGWNPDAELIFGYTAREAIGSSMQLLIPPECADGEAKFLAQIELGRCVEYFETVRLRKDGRRVYVSLTISPLRDNRGYVTRAAKILREITESKQAQEFLRSSEEHFRTMANSIPQLFWVARADGLIHWYNERWFDYAGTTPKQMEGWGWQSVHDANTLPKVMETWTGAIASAQPFEMEFPLRAAEGTFLNFLTRVQPFKDSQGRVMQWFGPNTDTNELKLMAESLQISQARLSSTLTAGSMGTWTWTIGKDRPASDEFTARMFSIKPDEAAKGMPVYGSCRSYDIEYPVLYTCR